MKILTSFTAILFSLVATFNVASADIWVNELHYDNTGGDSGEFLEVVDGPGMAGVDLSTVTLSLYNGNGGAVYNSESLNNFLVGDLVDGYQFYTWEPSSIQNGAPDGWAIDVAGTVEEFFSYEGTIVATDGAANGLTSTDIGVSEPGSTPIGESLQRTGSGSTRDDFTWTGPTAASSGSINSGQAFVAVPEPSSAAIAAGLFALAMVRRRR